MSPSPAPVPAWARGLEGVPGGVLAFAALCLLAMVAVVCGVLFEVGRVRRERDTSALGGGNLVIGRGQFAARMASAAIWCSALGLLAYATSWGWPRRVPALGLDVRAWLQVLGGAMILVLIGLALLAHDLWRVRLRAAVQERAFQEGLSALAQHEIERAQSHSSNPSARPGDRKIP